MTVAEAIAIAAAGAGAGTINTVVGSGTLLTFPVLLAVGYAPLTANVSNSLGLVPGSLSGAYGYRRELAGQRGGRWRPSERYELSSLRRALAKKEPYSVISYLARIVQCGAIEEGVFRELMRTPRMRTILDRGAPGVLKLREFAGYKQKKSKDQVLKR